MNSLVWLYLLLLHIDSVMVDAEKYCPLETIWHILTQMIPC